MLLLLHFIIICLSHANLIHTCIYTCTARYVYRQSVDRADLSPAFYQWHMRLPRLFYEWKGAQQPKKNERKGRKSHKKFNGNHENGKTKLMAVKENYYSSLTNVLQVAQMKQTAFKTFVNENGLRRIENEWKICQLLHRAALSIILKQTMTLYTHGHIATDH